ncbi:MAG: hypothetical protein IKS85_02015 [Lachnospiraceae bacterium]|nr:hypothetical protein [Lachnospiraceae bacterium]
MNEKSSKRREWVKSAAIVFLSILLLLTFFSQTILNHSLPEVATKTIQSGTITSKIRGNGDVESGDPYTVEVPANYVGRKVTSIAFRNGDKVEKGDLLITLADGEGTELQDARDALKTAEDALKTAQEAYDSAILNAGITNSDINTANSNITAASYRKMITELQNALQTAKDAVVPIQTAVDQLDQAIADCNTQLSYEEQKKELAAAKVATAQTAQTQAQAVVDNAQAALDEAKAAVEAINAESAALEASYAEDPDSHEDIEAERAAIAERLAQAQKAVEEKQKALDDANAKLDKANADLATAIREQEELEASQVTVNVSRLKAEYELSKYNYEKQLTAAKAEVDRIQEQLNDLISKIGDVTNLQSLQDRIDEARTEVNEKKKKVDELAKENGGTEIRSEISGTITSINVTSGKEIETRDVMVLQPEGQEFFLSFSVPNDQAKMVSVGDKASLVNSWYYYGDMDITLKSIKPNKQNPSKEKMLTFVLEGDVTVGQNLNLSVGSRSQNYDCIVPNSALRNDTNGDYILIVESKSSPLGNRYIATRVDVTVLASDDTQSAVRGALTGWEYVITTASAPIEAGSQVRMTDN